MQTTLRYDEFIDTIRNKPVGYAVRVEKKIAKQVLIENRNVVFNGRVYYLGIREIGLGLCEIWKAELAEQRETKMFPAKK
jgi:hypothetical protein